MKCRRWTPAPRELIRKAGRERRARDNPADDLVGYLWIWHLHEEGESPSRREVAADLGWTEHRARKMLDRVGDDRTDWLEVTTTDRPEPAQVRPRSAQIRPRSPSGSDGLPNARAQTSPAAAHNPPPTRARSTDTTTRTEQEIELRSIASAPRTSEGSVEALPAPGSSGPHRRKAGSSSHKVDLEDLWETLEDIRLEREPNARRSKLGARRQILRARVGEHGAESLVLAWRWWWNAATDRARFLRSGYRYQTFLRAGNLREYIELSQDWQDREADEGADLFDLGPDSFDENGNLIPTGT